MAKRWLVLGGAVLALSAGWPVAPASADSGTYAERRCGNQSSKVQLTFDDSADSSRVLAILDVLRAKRVRAGFFLTGRWARSQPHLLARIRSDGHWLGNHSATHANLRRISDGAIAGEVAGGVAGALFRPPYGAIDGRVRRMVNGAGYGICLWDIDTLDWRGRSAAQVHETVFSSLRPGAVVLAHLHGRHTLEALPGLIDGIRARGFELDGLSPFVSAAIGADGSPMLLERDGQVIGGVGGSDVVVPPIVSTGDAVALATRARGSGQWIAAASGGVYAVGGAPFHGADAQLNKPLVAVASTPSGDGYWTAASDGGVYSHGDAGFFGSTGDQRLNQPIVAFAPTPSGAGYWLLAGDGGVFSFGDAGFFGSGVGAGGEATFVAMTSRPDGDGYWLLRSDGFVSALGAAADHGNFARLGSDPAARRSFLAIAADGDGAGYALVSDHPGEVYRFR